jgi:hypothetical protein
MEKFWEKALSVTGPVAVVGFLLAMFINKLFEKRVLELFGSEKLFYLTMAILSILGSAFILSILVYRSKQRETTQEDRIEKDNKTKSATITASTIEGDIVFGNKTVNQDSKREQ